MPTVMLTPKMTKPSFKKEQYRVLQGILASLEDSRACAPSDEPEAITAVTLEYRHLVRELQRLAGPLLPPELRDKLMEIEVEIDDIYQAYDARSVIVGIRPEIEEALEWMGSAQYDATPLPTPLCEVVGDVLGSFIYRHHEINELFYEAGAVGEVPEGNCSAKCVKWLKRMHQSVPDPGAVLGKVLEVFMEVDREPKAKQISGRQQIIDTLRKYGFTYRMGGIIRTSKHDSPAKSLEELLRERDFDSVNDEFQRTSNNLDEDLPSAVTAASSMLESLFKVYIAARGSEMPSDESLKPLWNTSSKHLALDPSKVEDSDLRKILSGLISIVDGIGSLRTHAGSAHGRGTSEFRYVLKPRHARLTVHAAHTLALFFLETWDERENAVSHNGEPVR